MTHLKEANAALKERNAKLRAKYAAMVDLDEFLIPNLHNNLTSLLDELNKPNVASFSFQNIFFYLYWSNNTAVEDMEVKVPGYLVTMYKTYFEKDINSSNLGRLVEQYIARTDINLTRGGETLQVEDCSTIYRTRSVLINW